MIRFVIHQPLISHQSMLSVPQNINQRVAIILTVLVSEEASRR